MNYQSPSLFSLSLLHLAASEMVALSEESARACPPPPQTLVLSQITSTGAL